MAREDHHLLFLIINCLISFSTADDGAIMSKLSDSISPTPSTWKTDRNYCNWEGIFCDNSNRVTSIQLPSKYLNGTLPSDLNNLSQLNILDLKFNELSGALPTLANLTLLREIYLNSNMFTSIPVNFFVGLTNLRNFSINSNTKLVPWSLPNDLIQCTKLRTFKASITNVMGSLPDIFTSSPNLQELRLRNNNLTGPLPTGLNKLSRLEILALDNNSFSGPLPTLANLTLLQEVLLGNNKFTSIPADFLHGLTNLKIFNISNNSNLKPWSLPDDLKQSTTLQSFYADNANIIGSIPEIFGNFFNFMELSLSYNNLTGTLPATFNRLRINSLYLDNQLQGLSGKLDVLSSMDQLVQVRLQANSFSGAIPDLSRCTGLKNLQLRDNKLTGLVPHSLTLLFGLSEISLQNNKLQGPLPVFQNGVDISLAINTNRFCLPTPGECDQQVTVLLEVARDLGYPLSLAESWRGNDACVGWNFVSCDSSERKDVTTVNFNKQKFMGTISPSFANLTLLRNLLLNENKLVGSIPEILTSLPDLKLFDVSNNNLSGEIPKFAHKVKFLHKNNPLLGKQRGTVSVGVVIGSVISVLFFLGIVLFVFFKCYGVPSKPLIQNTRDGHSEMPISESSNIMISIQLLEQVTDNFSDKNVLGRGGFGVVYKGELPNGTKIAVKRMKSDEKGTIGMKEFQAEIEVLTKVRHRHLVALLGYCIDGNERLLVYEYMPQGTLSQHLIDWREHEGAPLSWKQRVSIALDVGRGVEYLHSLAQQSFIHRDLKPANILLDDEMRAKVADFGLVKHAPEGNQSMETILAGTYGYLAPEYAATGRVTTRVDVYAFGVILMQLITGLKALDKTMPDERRQLVTWLRKVPISKENMVTFIDKVLDTDDNETLQSILKVAELAHQCTATQPFHRPDMDYVVTMLGALVGKWKPSQLAEENTYHCHHMSLPEVLLSNDDDTISMLKKVQSNSF